MLKLHLLIAALIVAANAQEAIPGCEAYDDSAVPTCKTCRKTNGWNTNATAEGKCGCLDSHVPNIIDAPTSCQDKQYLPGCKQAPPGNPPQLCEICDEVGGYKLGDMVCICAEGYIPEMQDEWLQSCIFKDPALYPPECVEAHWAGPTGHRCSKCQDGYLFTDNTWMICTPYSGPSGCEFAASETSCAQCKRGYLADADPITACWEYTQGALNCEFASGVNQCAVCEDDYIPRDPEITMCVQDPGVAKCLYADYMPLRCTACEPGYYLDAGYCYKFGLMIRMASLTLLVSFLAF